VPPDPLISDMEDGNPFYGAGCPKGEWFLSKGGGPATATVSPAPGPVLPVACDRTPESTKCIHISGAGQANMTKTSYDAYVSLAATLNQPSETEKSTLNASAYTGVTFWGKVTGAIYLQVSDTDTDPSGGICAGGTCNDHAEAPLTPSGTTWVQYSIPFSALMQEGFGFDTPTGVNFPKSTIYAVLFKISIATYPAATPAWDLWIDDMRFY
jgi:hypothetical protein